MQYALNANWVAYFGLLIWPLVAFYLYSTLPIPKATLWTILGAFLLLPVDAEIKFAGIPAFDKGSIPNLAAIICCTFIAGRLPRVLNGFGVAESLLVIFLVGPFVTSSLNSDPIQIGQTVLPGVGSYDALSTAVSHFIFITPFFLGREFLRRAENTAEIMKSLAVAGLAYSLPMLFEIRMSPQLSTWIYGYSPIAIFTTIRDGGFRPIVFLPNGLWVAFFAATATVASAVLWRGNVRVVKSFPPGAVTGYLAVVLALCKTMGAFIYALILVPLVRWTSPRSQMRVACVFAFIALTYPLLRAENLVPTEAILKGASAISTDRAQSLGTRFDNEDQLLARAWQRPYFGWGRFGRSRVYNGWNGGDTSLTDGEWIITIGAFGIVGFVAEFGLLALTVFRGAAALKFTRTRRDREYLAALALIVAINMIDLLPNASISPWTWLLAGALIGRAEAVKLAAQQESSSTNTMFSAPGVREARTSSI